MGKNKSFLSIVIIAILIKILLFAFAVIYVPQSKFENDSVDYLETGRMLASQGVFAKQFNNGSIEYEYNRTPGYPLFLAVSHGLMKIPLSGVMFLQVILTILTAVITYKTAVNIDAKIGFLSAAVILYDPSITIFSLMIMSEVLYLCVISLFMLIFIRYLKNRRIRLLVLSAVVLVAATYVRPISYYLGAAMALFIVYANICDNPKRAVLHALIFFIVVYSLLGVWQLRNYIRLSDSTFSYVIQNNPRAFGLLHSYATNKDPFTQGLSPVSYYINVTWRCFLSLMTRPGPFKYFHSHAITAVGKIFGYPLVFFWFTGFLIGIIRARCNIYYQFMLLSIGYFIFTSVGSAMWIVGERFRVPMMSFIAIISAFGWGEFKNVFPGWLRCRKKNSMS